ncbi:hypothetical protein [Billgrantia desiderata]|nr:hypothetical protein [Halomonas desiderata]
MRYQTRTEDVDSFRGLRYIHGVTFFNVSMLTIFLYLYLLSPYFDLRGMMLHGGVLSILLFLLVNLRLVVKALQQESLILIYIFFCLYCLYNLVMITIYSEAFTTSFLMYMIQVCFYLLTGFVLAQYLMRKALDVDQVITLCFKLVSFIVLVNAAIIILEYQFPPFRNLVESMLYQPEDANINYLTREYRLRGIASGGAANLSLLHGTVLIILQALYIKKKIGLLYTLVASVTIFTSLLFIGRTGILLAFVGIVMFHLLNLVMAREKLSFHRIILYFTVASIILVAPPVFAIFFPENVLAYSINFFYQGMEGVQQEGTTRTVARMFEIPDIWTKLIFGVGAHWGDFTLEGRVDAGYMKMLTALGIPIAVSFYLFYAYLARYLLMITHYKSIWIVLMIIMFIAEIKEPFIFKGYSARMIWMMIGIGICYSFCSRYSGNERVTEAQ